MAPLLILMGFLILAYSLRGYQERLIIMGVILYMSLVTTYVYIFSGRMRLYLAIILIVAGNKELLYTLKYRYTLKGTVSIVLWTLYLIISHMVVNTGQIDTNTIYAIIGDLIIYLLAVTYIMNSTEKGIMILVYAIVFGYMTNIVVYIPRVLPILQFIPHSEYYHHGAVGVSCFRVMPFLIFLYKSINNTMTIKKVIYAVFILTTFIVVYLSGSRTGIIGVALVIILYTRNIKTILFILISLFAAYQIINYKSESKFAEERYERLINAFEAGNPRSLDEVDFRLRHFEISLDSFKEQPIWGKGYGSWSAIRGSSLNMVGSTLSAHSAYATLIGETGLIGIFLFMLLIVMHFKGLSKKDSIEMNERLSFIIFIGIIPFLLMGINSSSFWHREFIIYLGFANGVKSRGMLQKNILSANEG